VTFSHSFKPYASPQVVMRECEHARDRELTALRTRRNGEFTLSSEPRGWGRCMHGWRKSRGREREMDTQQANRPVITPAMREQARKQPNSWLYVIDPIFTDPNADVPPWGYIGGYRVDERGGL